MKLEIAVLVPTFINGRNSNPGNSERSEAILQFVVVVVVVTCSSQFSWYSLSNTQRTLTFALKLLTGRLGSDHYHSKLASASDLLGT